MSAIAAPAGRRERLARLCHRTGLTGVVGRARSVLRKDVRILAYHRVVETIDEDRFDFDLDLISANATRFRAQMEHLCRHYRPTRLDAWLTAVRAGHALPKDSVIVTFDDGYDDNHRVAFPILRELGVPAVFFVSTGHIDSGRPYAYDWLVHMLLVTHADRLEAPEIDLICALPPSRPQRRALASHVLTRMKWLEAAAQASLIDRLERQWQLPRGVGHRDCRPMDWNQVREMRDAGMEIGGHGVDHHMLAKLPDAQMRREIHESKARLDAELGPVARTMSYPVGNIDAYDAGVIAQAQSAGFQAACSYLSGTNAVSPGDWWSLRRLAVEREMELSWFASMLALPEVFSYPSQLRSAPA